MKSKSVLFLGGGNMGTALALLVARNGHNATIWTIEKDVIKTINEEHHNNTYLPGVELPKNVFATGNLKQALAENNLIISALPTQVVEEVFKQYVENFTSSHSILSVSKGFVIETGETVSQFLSKLIFKTRVAVLMGPLLAKEIAESKPCAGVIASKDQSTRTVFKELLCNDIFQVQESNDVLGAESAGALKNVYAILMGILAGLGYGWNTQSAFITIALQEISQALEYIGGKRETAYGLAGLGDLVTTGFGEQSRNRRFGKALSSMRSVKKAVGSIGQVVEGMKTLEAVDRVLSGCRASFPLLELIKKLVKDGTDVRAELEHFFKKIYYEKK